MVRTYWPVGGMEVRVGGAKIRKVPCMAVGLTVLCCFLYLAPVSWLSVSGGGGAGPTVVGEEEGDPLLPFNFPHPAENINEDLVFRYFDSDVSYQTDGVAGRSLTRHEVTLLQSAREAATRHLRPAHAFLSGRYRWLPEGVEYDLLYKDEDGGSDSRVTLYQKLESPRVVRSMAVNQSKVVNVVITLQGRVNKYATFLDHLVKKVLPEDPNLTLTVIYFSDQYLQEARDLTATTFSTLPNFKWNFIPLEETDFSRGRGMHVAAQQLAVPSGESDQLLFFCDVDVLMHPDFFTRCRSNTKPGLQVYYPVVFSLYNPGLVYPLLDRPVPSVSEQLNVDVQSGFWRTFGYGMACMYRQDYLATGGFPDLRTWGGEDVTLYKQFLEMEHIKVIRAPDPSLFHVYHHKECGDTDSESYVACLKSKVVTEGSQMQLGLTLLKVQHGTDLEGILSKRFYYFWLLPYLFVLLVISLLTNLVQALHLLYTKRARTLRNL
ncbi:hypothetical protein Pcinc_012713 [Petrolisthes cinctipes]|uniref:Hexosyltransferase n=1 Tax=Petrolisthes cinctipes TaxID=88211 RepID=A0AAE1G0N7_PETCI|nr:hypothetical protein Pcinc_012713 [Petrolisthes cinctipes]